MNHSDNKHCVETKWSCLYHYRNNVNGDLVACGVNDHPIRAELTPAIRRYPMLNFELPRQRHELDNVLRLMESAYERGQRHKMEEISNTLKSVIGI